MSIPRFIVLVSAYAYAVVGQQQGDLRFRGSFSDGTSGRLEVFIDNQWGTICIDGFTELSADTACRQLGSVEALTFGEAERLGYGRGSGRIHITELECSSNDIHILHCNVRNTILCAHSSDVAVVCSAQSAFEFDSGTRLVDGPYRSEGILEVFFFGQWGGICGSTFDIVTADAACIALGYTRSRSAPRIVSRFQNTSSPVWLISSSINCVTLDSCFDTCYRDPVNRNDLSSDCSNNFIYLTCEFVTTVDSQCLAIPFDPDIGGDFGVGGSVSEQETDTTALAIIFPIVFGVPLIILLIVYCTACEGYKLVKSCFKSCYESCCECLGCCYGGLECGCLSILRFFDIRRCCKDRNNEGTVVNTAARSTINQELESLEMAAMNQPSAAVHHASSDHKGGRNEPPDYRNALKYKKDDEDDEPPPPSYDSVV